MWELDCEESWALKNWCFWTVVLEKTLESPLDCNEIQPVHSKGDQSWVFFGRSDVETETLILWPPHAESWLIGKDPDAGRDWGQEEKGTTEDEMAGWHHRLDGHEFGWTLGVGDGQGGLESDMTEQLNWNEGIYASHWLFNRGNFGGWWWCKGLLMSVEPLPTQGPRGYWYNLTPCFLPVNVDFYNVSTKLTFTKGKKVTVPISD